MAKKNTKSGKKGFSFDETSVKALLTFFVLLLAFGVFLLFTNYQESLLNSPSLKFLTSLVVVLSALLVGLLFLINPQKRK